MVTTILTTPGATPEARCFIRVSTRPQVVGSIKYCHPIPGSRHRPREPGALAQQSPRGSDRVSPETSVLCLRPHVQQRRHGLGNSGKVREMRRKAKASRKRLPRRAGRLSLQRRGGDSSTEQSHAPARPKRHPSPSASGPLLS